MKLMRGVISGLSQLTLAKIRQDSSKAQPQTRARSHGACVQVAISGAHGCIALQVVDERRFAEECIRLDDVDLL